MIFVVSGIALAIGLTTLNAAIGQVASGTAVMAAAAIGVLVNGATTLLFLRGREHDLNVRGAFVHMAADTAVSVGVIAAGAVIYFTGWAWVDPAVSLAIAGIIFASTWNLLRRSTAMALDAVPSHIDLDAVERYLQSLPGVTAVHDLHVWPLSTSQTALTAHLVRPSSTDDDALLAEAAETLRDRFSIDHTTIQMERGGPVDLDENDGETAS